MTVQISERQSWLSQWIDDQGVQRRKDLKRALQSQSGRQSLEQILDQQTFNPPERSTAFSSLAAGARLDLSASLGGCRHADCLIHDAKALLSRTCVYFDEVIVSGPSAEEFKGYLDDDLETAELQLEGFAGMLLYLKSVGADRLLTFRDKPLACGAHLRQHAEEAGIVNLLDGQQEWIDMMAGRAVVQAEWVGRAPGCRYSHWAVKVDHVLDHSQWLTVHAPKRTPLKQVTSLALKDLGESAIATLTSDVRFSRAAGASLGIGLDAHHQLPSVKLPVTPNDVAFRLNLPVVKDGKLADILALSLDEADSRRAFQSALKQAMTTTIDAAATSRNANAASIATEVQNDVIEPALADISNRLKASKRLLARGTATNLAVTAVTTIVGMMTNVPVELAGLATAVLGAPDLKRLFSDRKEIELSDYYYLWRVGQNSTKP